jgi:TolB-like protein
MTRTRLRLWIPALVVVALPAMSCAAIPVRLFVNRQADMTMYKKIAVVPFTNLSGDPYAGARVTRAFTTELVIADRFQLIDPALFLAELERTGAQADAQGQLDPDKLRATATKLDAAAVIRGAVNEYTMRRVGTDEYPMVSFDAEMVDVATGTIVWRITVTESGRGRLPVIGGPGERSFTRVTEEACRRAVRELRKRVF